ncbi:tRNA dimethylallyltransferase [Malassezia vespertilionis]|uniref:(2E,6E)-farnesyl diphosphate synthase n=1 Tax=Malassezia vespertilionis TaxID=2020962 RepID=A0A2N1J9S1_9BASI|nr:tRNA dimethylallyltransferase [Malassezia vespertilionis]PKI83297.1 Coq1p [Malassezia vespertilionis]WFD07576.1 tRNA dimethylallyltransferase [Malassezia vespertilionis]
MTLWCVRGRWRTVRRVPLCACAFLHNASGWSGVLDNAKQALVGGENVNAMLRDPLDVVGQELSSTRHNIASLLGSGHPSLDKIGKYYFQAEGKHVRPMVVMLIAKATNGLSPAWANERIAGIGADVDETISPERVLNDVNPSAPDGAAPAYPIVSKPYRPALQQAILPTQRRLAEITEMIHVASLLHDDVIDASPMRRGEPSAPSTFGNKLSILGGDFLLGRASIALARLRDPEVIELMSTVIANLVEGEVMQMRAQSMEQLPVTDVGATLPSDYILDTFWASGASQPENGPTAEMFRYYLQKTYLKTASLLAKSARSAVVLGGCGQSTAERDTLDATQRAAMAKICDTAYVFGRNVGIAFQLVDDLLDFKSSSEAFGKPSGGADLQLGLATAPVLYAWQELPDSGMGEMVRRRFSREGDVQEALAIVRRSGGLERTAELARYHAFLAEEALRTLPESDARAALMQLNQQIITRIK